MMDIPETKEKDATPSKRRLCPGWFPWWLYTMLAAVAYIVPEYLLPLLHKDLPALVGLQPVFDTAAPVVAALLLLLAGAALYSDSPPPSHEDTEREE